MEITPKPSETGLTSINSPPTTNQKKTLPPYIMPGSPSTQTTPQERSAEIIEGINLEELGSLLDTYDEKITGDLKSLEESKKKNKLFEKFSKTTKTVLSIHQTYNFLSKNFKNGVLFLQDLFPEILKKLSLDKRNDFYDKLILVSNLNKSFLYALGAGFQGLALIYRAKILQKTEELYTEAVATYQNQLEHTPMDDQNKSKKLNLLQNWFAEIKKEKKELREDTFDYKLTTTSRTFSMLKYVLNYLPIQAKIIKFLGTGIATTLSGLEIIALSVETTKAKKNIRTLHKQMSPLQRNDFSIEQHTKAAALLQSRKERVSNQVLQLRHQVNQILQLRHQVNQNAKVKNGIKKIFQQKMHLLKLMIEDPHTSLEAIETELKKWNFGDRRILKRLEIAKLGIKQPLTRRSRLNRAKFVKEFTKWEQNQAKINKQFEIVLKDIALTRTAPFDFKNIDVKDNLLIEYVNHQGVIDNTIKNSLKQLVQKRHENNFEQLNVVVSIYI